MKITKKFLSILLATILILSVFPVTLAQASDNAITFTAETDAQNVKVGDTVSVSVNMSEYNNLGALTLYVNYDSTALEIVDVQTNNAFGYEEFNTDYGSGKLAYLIASLDTKTVSGTLFTIQFEVLKEGCTEVSLTVDELTDIDLNKLSSSTQSAKVHKFNNGTVTPPTCTEQGYTTYVCECGNSYADNYVDAFGHSFGNWTTENAPTCTETGLEKRVCSACGETETNELSSIGHDYDYNNGVLTRPTETVKGFYTYTCKNDISHITTEEVESADYTEYNKVARKLEEYLSNSNITSEAKSYIMAECVNIMRNNAELYNFSSLTERRDLIVSEQYIVDKATREFNEFFQVVDSVIANCELGNHDVRAYISNDNATCTVNGTKRGACYYCGSEVIVDDENNPALGHDIVVDNAVTPTCTGTGLTEGSHCSRCDDATTEQEVVPALGHSYNPVVTSPTCTEGGYTTYSCACGDTYVSDETSATGHDYEEEITKPATHTENGVMTYTCHCGDTYTETINATGDHFHTPTVTPPTCTEGGFTTYTCVCGDTYIDDYVDALGHKYESEITKPATHLAEGLMTYTCHCGDSYTEVIEKIAEHNHEAVVTPPTCTEQGFTTYTCECGDTYVADYVNANGHSYNSVVTVPTCTEQGFTTYTCAVCNDTYVDDEIPATGHSYQNGICTVCDYADPNYFVFSVKEPSITKIRNKDGIILHAEIEGNRPEGSYVEWTVDNGNFDKTAMNNGDELRVIANNKGYTTFTATLYDADGNELAKDTVELYSQSGFFDKIGGIFRSLFGTTKIYEK